MTGHPRERSPYRAAAAAVAVGFILVIAGGAADGTPASVDRVLEGRLLDAAAGTVVDDGVVVIRGDRIACSGPRDACSWPEGTPVEDYGEAMILPGLIDMHVHARAHYAGAFVPSGVTTIRDANNSLGVIRELRTVEGGPRVFASGPLLDGPDSFLAAMTGAGGSPGDGPLEELVPILVEDTGEARSAVEILDEAGVDLVKLYQGLSPEAFTAATDAARNRGLPVAADVGTAGTGGLAGDGVDIVQAAEAGVSTIEHLSGLTLAYQRRGGGLFDEELDERILDDIAEELLATDVAAVPTLTNAFQFAEPGSLTMEGLPGLSIVRPFLEETHWPRLLAWAGQMREGAVAERRLILALLTRLHDGGMTIAAGSDVPAAPYVLFGSALHQELEALVRAGLEPVEALQAATVDAARLLDRDDLGHLEAGARADVLVVDGDPTLDILDTRHVRAVWFDGEPVDLDGAWSEVEAALEEFAREM